MRSVNIAFTLSVLIGTLQADVIIEKVNIATEFYGPFNKTKVEVIFHNPTKRDSLEGFFGFETSKSAIVYDLWLDIDGKLKKAETLWRRTGEIIYDRVTRGRTFMLKTDNF